MLAKEIEPPGIVMTFKNNNNTWEVLKKKVKYQRVECFYQIFTCIRKKY